MYHIDANGVATVTPDYLYHPSGVVPHPLQRSGQIPHAVTSGMQRFTFHQGHGFIGSDRSVIKTPSQS